jgi:hypothetical protein
MTAPSTVARLRAYGPVIVGILCGAAGWLGA